MKYLLGRLSKEEIDPTEPGFKDAKGNEFYFKAEVEDDCLTITDTIGRSLPIDYTQYSDFAQMFTNLVRYEQAKEHMNRQLHAILAYGSNA